MQSSNSYEILYSRLTKSYNDQVPLFVSQRGINPAEFKKVINECSRIANEGTSKSWALSTLLSIVYGILDVILFILLCVAMFSFFGFYRIDFIAIMIVFFVFFIIVIVLSVGYSFLLSFIRKSCWAQIKNDTLAVLEKANEETFMKRGIQLMFQSKISWLPFAPRAKNFFQTLQIQVPFMFFFFWFSDLT